MNAALFNAFPTFYDVVRHGNLTETELNDVGAVLVSEGLETKYGIFLLHKHFDLRGEEILVRFSLDEFGVTLPLQLSPQNASPISWCMGGDRYDQVEVCEYTARVGRNSTCDEVEVARILRRIWELGYGRRVGVFLLDSLPKSNTVLFETTDDDVRVAVVSKWIDSAHQDNLYEQSTFAFRLTGDGCAVLLSNTGVACANTTSCYGCAPSSPAIKDAFALQGLGSGSDLANALGQENAEPVLRTFARAFEQAIRKS